MRVSNRITTLTDGGGDGWEIYDRARALAAAGEAVTDLTIGDHDIRTDPGILAAMDRAARGGHTGYAAIAGTDALREAVAGRTTERTGVPTTRDNVLVTPGGQAALFAAHHATCDPGDVALFVAPYYATYPGTIRAAGATPLVVRARAEDAFQPRAADISADAGAARSLLINSPNNPTGAVYTRETLAGIAATCREHDLWLISDEVYDSQVWSGRHLSPRALPGMADRTLVIGSMSKSHAMTGARCGWVVGPEAVIGHLTELATHTNYGVAGFVQDAAAFALSQGRAAEDRVARTFRRRRDLALAILSGQNQVVPVPPDGAMYLMLDVRAADRSGLDFAHGLLDAHRIAVMPGESFGDAAAGHIRVALTVDDERLAAALKTICAFATARAA